MEVSTNKVHAQALAPQEQAPEDLSSLQDSAPEIIYGLKDKQRGSIEELMSDTSSEAQEQMLDSEIMLENVSEHQRELEAALEERRAHLNKVLDDKFEELSTLLKMKKVNLSLTLESFFKKERQRLSLLLGSGSDLYRSLADRLSVCRDSTRDSQILSKIEEEVEQLTGKLNSTALKEQVRTLKKKLSGVSDSMADILTSKVSLASQFGIESTIFTENFDEFSPENITKERLDSYANPKSFRLNTSLEFEVCDGHLEIMATGRQSKNQMINVAEWINITEVRLKLDKFTYGEEDIKTIGCIWNELEHIDCIRIDGSFQKEVPEDKLVDLFTVTFSNAQFLREIEINFQETPIGDESLTFLMEDIIPRALTLKSLNLNLQNTNFTDKTIQAFRRNASPCASKLESFILHIGHAQVSEDCLIEMFVRFPVVKNFDLCVSCCTNFGDTALKAFVNVTLPSMVSLENLTLRAWKTKITDEGAKELFKNIPDIRSFTLDLGSNKVTDDGVNELISGLLPDMRNLESFELRLYDTEVTEQIVNQIYQIKRNLPN